MNLRNGAIAALTLASAVALYMAYERNLGMKDKTLKVAFPMGLLKAAPQLVDFSDLETIFEYYLGENLTVGLVRDSQDDARGYEGVLAESWDQVDPKTWIFRIRPDLKWSDGSALELSQLANHYEALKDIDSRHISHLKKLVGIEFDKAESTLIFRFSENTNKGVLHELSLTDCGLTHPNFGQIGLKITSGPYYLEHFDEKEKAAVLRKNPYSPLSSSESPNEVTLINAPKKEDFGKLFDSIDVDIAMVPLGRFNKEYRQAEKNARGEKIGVPTLIHFVKFSEAHELAQDLKARQEFAAILYKATESLNLDKNFRLETQMIPEGFSGRLSSFEWGMPPVEALKGKTLNFKLNGLFKEWPEFLVALKAEAKTHGVTINGKYSKSFRDVESDDFASSHAFVGNQKSATGSWNFLFSLPNGALGEHREKFKTELESITVASGGGDADIIGHLESLHRKVLKQARLVPFLVIPLRALTSDRVDLSRWNPFDMRMRFYEVRWK